MILFPNLNSRFGAVYSLGQRGALMPLVSALGTAFTAGAGASAPAAAAGGISTGAGILGGSAISAGSSLLGGLLGGQKESKPSPAPTMSWNQRNVNNLIFDWLMGIQRDNKGNETSRNPLLTQLSKMQRPQQRVAGFTDRQQGALGMADALAPRVTNLQRPDPQRQAQLAQGILPTDPNFKQRPRGMALGGPVQPGETVVVGEDGPEMLTALPGGGAEVAPNPRSIASPADLARALARERQIEQQTGVPGAATGRMGPSYRAYETDAGKYWINNDDMFSSQTGWQDTPYSQTMRSDFESTMQPTWAQRFQAPGLQDYGYGTDQWDHSGWSDALKKYHSPEEAQWRTWYNLYENRYGGDIDKMTGAIGRLYPKWSGPADFNMLHPTHQDWLGTYWNEYQGWADEHLGAGTQYNPDIAGVFAGDDRWNQADAAKFAQWMNQPQNTNPYGAQMAVGPTGQWEFADSFAMTPERLQGSLDHFYGEGGPGYVDPNAEPPVEPYDYGALAGQLTPEQHGAFNEFLGQYQGGALAGMGVNYNPTTGQQEFGYWDGRTWTPMPQNIAPGMEAAVQQFMADPTGGAGAGTGGPETPTPTGPTTEQQNATGNIPYDLTPILMGMAGTEFDPTKYQDEFQRGVYDPTMDRFESDTRPAIRETFAGGNLFGSARERSEASARMELEKSLAANQAQYVAGARQSHENRQQAAISQAMQLAQLPTNIASAQADVDTKRAVAANTWNNMDIQNAVLDANLSNQELLGLMSLWQLYGAEQSQYNQEFAVDFANALGGQTAGGVDWATLLNMLTQYQGESQIAYVA